MFIKIIDSVTKASFFVASLALALIVIIFCMEIIMRYFFAAPTSWGPDTVTFLFCASLMLAMPEVTRENSHIAVSIILDFSPHSFAQKFKLVLYAVSFCVVSYVFYVTMIEFVRLFEAGINTLGSFRVPKWIVFGFIPFGLGLSAIQFVVLIKKQLSENLVYKKGA